eukprot:COSAG02_NODE_22923_length_735_cov_3.323899_1_plen_52_part_10
MSVYCSEFMCIRHYRVLQYWLVSFLFTSLDSKFTLARARARAAEDDARARRG